MKHLKLSRRKNSLSEPEKIPHSNNRYKQQSIPHIYTEHSTLSVSIAMLVIVIVCISLGITVIIESDRVFQLTLRYDNFNNYTYKSHIGVDGPVVFEFNQSNYSTGDVVVIPFTLNKSITAPIFIQYKIVGFHQNFRPYSTSVDQNQLRGQHNKISDSCQPFRYPGEVYGKRIAGYYIPCGSVAWSMFNDTFSLFNENDELICNGSAFDVNGNSLVSNNYCHKKSISTKSDREHRFREISHNEKENNKDIMWSGDGVNDSSNPYLAKGYYYLEPGHRIPYINDEDFIVWANSNYIANFLKLYRVIDIDLPAGNYYFKITELFDMYSIKGSKYVQLSTRTWLGARNYVLGIMLTIVGSISFVFVLTIQVLRFISYPRRIKGEWQGNIVSNEKV